MFSIDICRPSAKVESFLVSLLKMFYLTLKISPLSQDVDLPLKMLDPLLKMLDPPLKILAPPLKMLDPPFKI